MILTAKEITYLAPSFSDQTAISLFSNIKATQDGTEYSKLISKGIIQNNGYEPKSLEMLLQMTKPERCARIIAKNEFFVIEKYVYRSGDQLLLAENKNGEFVFKMTSDFSDVSLELSEVFSMSNIKTAEVSISLKPDEMIVLLAIFDIYRKNTLLNYAGNNNQAEVLSLQEVTSELSGGFENGLVKIIVKNYGYTMPNATDAEKLLGSLVEKECLIFDQGYRLTENYALVATNFLVINALVLLENFQVLSDGDVLTNGGFFAFAGMHNILSFAIDAEDNTILLSSVSAYQMLSAIESVLACPVFAKEIAMQNPGPVASNEWTCECGRINSNNFCSACGSTRLEK